jgi:DNA mismatch repair protein MutS
MAKKDTPMMQQYKRIKAEYAGFLLFYRMGDFYELFGDDAVKASGILDITLTQRRSSKEVEGVPMCGVPFHAAEGYIAKLLKNKQKVALCEQTETPAQAKEKRGNGALVNREVIRLYTSGTLTEDSMLKSDENNYLVAINSLRGQMAISWSDLSTGEFLVSDTSIETLAADIARLNPQEIVLTEALFKRHYELLAFYKEIITPVENDLFDITPTSETYPNLSQQTTAGGLLKYIEKTQIDKTPVLKAPQTLSADSFLYMDAATRHNLELTHTLKGERKNSLMASIDRTITPSGSRKLSQWITSPLQNIDLIQQRQNVIKEFKNDLPNRTHIRELLKQTSDIGRSISRITLDRSGPRDLQAVSKTLELFPEIMMALSAYKENKTVASYISSFSHFNILSNVLMKALINDALPLLARDGNFIQNSYCEELNKYKNLTSNGLNLLKELERSEAESTGISSLRIKYNKVWGYFLEVTKTHAKKVPENYIHRQTTTNAQRFSTTELMELEREYSSAEAYTLKREMEIFSELVILVKEQASLLLDAAESLASLDVLVAGAELAEQKNYNQPTIDNSFAFDIENGRHPVVECVEDQFIPNNTDLSNNEIWLVTGPNMAGKSTFLRQNALIAILAHMGYFVPATKAHIGLVDRIFTRIGAADELSKGQSTFMVEMVETANILNNSTERSLVVLDEIGRGTATYDGLSIAWACIEHLLIHNKCRGIFATHYHEMTKLAEDFPKLKCYHVAAKEWEGSIIFLHQIKEGASPGSYGIHVGQLAGLPKSVTQRASHILSQLEKTGAKGEQVSSQMNFFQAQPQISKKSKVEEALHTILVDELTPREAHELLYDLKSMVKVT